MTNQHAARSVARRCVLPALACLTAWSTLHAQDAPPPIPRPDLERTSAYPVARVIDARTVSVLIDDGERRVVLCGVAAPASRIARDQLLRFLENLLKGEAVFLRYDPAGGGDSEDPASAYVFRAPDGLFVNLEVVRQGYGKVQAKPACELLRLMRHYEKRAKQARKGVWAPPSQRERVSESGVASSQPAPDNDEIIVYVTKSGKKYHRKGCYHLRKSAQPMTLREAVEKGYQPCSHCKPPTLENP